MSNETWVDVAWGDIRVGDKLRFFNSPLGWVPEPAGVVLGLNFGEPHYIKVELEGKSVKWTNSFHYRKLVKEETVGEKWVDIEDISDLAGVKPGDRIKWIFLDGGLERIHVITRIAGEEIHWASGYDTLQSVRDGDTKLQVLETKPEHKVLKKAFAPKDDGWRPKEIPDIPGRCTHCGAPAYVGLSDVECTGDCEGSRRGY